MATPTAENTVALNLNEEKNSLVKSEKQVTITDSQEKRNNDNSHEERKIDEQSTDDQKLDNIEMNEKRSVLAVIYYGITSIIPIEYIVLILLFGIYVIYAIITS